LLALLFSSHFQGVVLLGLANLYNATRNRAYTTLGDSIIEAVTTSLVTTQGVLNELAQNFDKDSQQFKGIFMRYGQESFLKNLFSLLYFASTMRKVLLFNLFPTLHLLNRYLWYWIAITKTSKWDSFIRTQLYVPSFLLHFTSCADFSALPLWAAITPVQMQHLEIFGKVGELILSCY
jgi:hypothetical protein